MLDNAIYLCIMLVKTLHARPQYGCEIILLNNSHKKIVCCCLTAMIQKSSPNEINTLHISYFLVGFSYSIKNPTQTFSFLIKEYIFWKSSFNIIFNNKPITAFDFGILL